MAEVRFIELAHDYHKLKRWWELRKFPPADPRFMPPTGLMVTVYGIETAAGFLFKSDANAAIIGNIVSNPEAPGKARHEALTCLLDALTAIAASEGFGMVCCSTNLEPLKDRFKTHGFVMTDEGVSNFGRIL